MSVGHVAIVAATASAADWPRSGSPSWWRCPCSSSTAGGGGATPPDGADRQALELARALVPAGGLGRPFAERHLGLEAQDALGFAAVELEGLTEEVHAPPVQRRLDAHGPE